MSGLLTAALTACAFALACGNGARPSPSSPPPSPPPPPTAGARVVLPSGLTIALEVARTDAERAQGLMFREFLEPGAGMVFLFPRADVYPFWMKNCHFPLDIVHTTADGTVVDVLANVPPCASDPCPSYAPKGKADTVVELNAGVAAANGVVPGARLSYRDVPDR